MFSMTDVRISVPVRILDLPYRIGFRVWSERWLWSVYNISTSYLRNTTVSASSSQAGEFDLSMRHYSRNENFVDRHHLSSPHLANVWPSLSWVLNPHYLSINSFSLLSGWSEDEYVCCDPIPTPLHRFLSLQFDHRSVWRFLCERIQASFQSQGWLACYSYHKCPVPEIDSHICAQSIQIQTLSKQQHCDSFRTLVTSSLDTAVSWTGSTVSIWWQPSSTFTCRRLFEYRHPQGFYRWSSHSSLMTRCGCLRNWRNI